MILIHLITIYVDYLSSVRALQSSSPVAELDRSPVKSAIKMTRSVSKK